MGSSFVRSGLAGALLLVLAAAAHSQIYRSVGPDGKVTFTDKPPTAETAQARAQAAQPPAAPAASAAPAALAAPPVVGAPSRGAGVPQPAAGMERSVRDVIGEYELVQAFRSTCGFAFPDEQKRYGTAADQWADRNKAFAQRALDVAGTLLGEDGRMQLRSVVVREAHNNADRAARVPTPAARTWCEDRLRDLAPGGKSDQVVQAGHAVLATYQPPRK